MHLYLMLHAICNDEVDRSNGYYHSLSVNVNKLESFVETARKAGYRFISIDESVDLIKQGRTGGKFIVVTVDDGYSDLYHTGYPFFRSFDIPFAVYAATSFIGSNKHMWWHRVNFLVSRVDDLQCKGVMLQKRVIGPEKVFDAVNEMLSKESDVPIALDRLYSENGVSHDQVPSNFMNWDELRKLSDDSLCVIGSHTHNHMHADKLSDDQFVADARISLALLKKEVNVEAVHFSYPFGSHLPRHADMIRTMGFVSAVTTNAGAVTNDVNLYRIPRFQMLDSSALAAFEKFGRPTMRKKSPVHRVFAKMTGLLRRGKI